jgi:hypothetical protein
VLHTIFWDNLSPDDGSDRLGGEHRVAFLLSRGQSAVVTCRGCCPGGQDEVGSAGAWVLGDVGVDVEYVAK